MYGGPVYLATIRVRSLTPVASLRRCRRKRTESVIDTVPLRQQEHRAEILGSTFSGLFAQYRLRPFKEWSGRRNDRGHTVNCLHDVSILVAMEEVKHVCEYGKLN